MGWKELVGNVTWTHPLCCMLKQKNLVSLRPQESQPKCAGLRNISRRGREEAELLPHSLVTEHC